MNNLSLGDRMKLYEAVERRYLTRRVPVVIRVDGKAFHSWTKGCAKPFDEKIMETMVMAARETAEQMQGFKVAYVQSDEATFVLTDDDSLETEAWFGNNLNKLVSITASMFTAYFNRHWFASKSSRGDKQPALFDARAFNVPHEDVINMLLWRAQDWRRNSLNMFAQSFFSHKQLKGKKAAEVHEMLYEIGENWAVLPSMHKNGTYLYKLGSEMIGWTSTRAKYDQIEELLSANGITF